MHSALLVHVWAVLPHVVGTSLFAIPARESGGGILGLSYDPALSALLQALVFIANVAGGIIVGVGTIRGLITFLVDLLGQRGGDVPKEGIRLALGRSLALALEFQLGADILGTALNPSRQDIEILGAIVILRTVLNFFLQRELREAQRREGVPKHPDAVLEG